MKKALLSFVFIALAPVLALADTVSLALENDTLSFPKKDSEYTHGTELTYMADSGWWVFNNIGFEIEQTMYGPKLDNTDIGQCSLCSIHLALAWLDHTPIPSKAKRSSMHGWVARSPRAGRSGRSVMSSLHSMSCMQT